MTLQAFIHWGVNPDLAHFGPLTLRWYGLLFAILFVVGYWIVRWQFRIEHKDANSLDTLLIYLVISTIVGARLGHCLLYDPAYYLSHPLEILEVWKGGLASHGGVIAILISLYFYCRRRPDQPYLWLLDRLAVPAALASSLIRLGNLFNSEILGTPTQMPWAFVFTREDLVPRHPAQLYESLSYALTFVFLFLLYRRSRERTPRGLLLGLFLTLVFTARFLIEFVKQRQAAYAQNFPLSVGQILSIPFIVAGLILVWRAFHRPAASKEVEHPCTRAKC